MKQRETETTQTKTKAKPNYDPLNKTVRYKAPRTSAVTSKEWPQTFRMFQAVELAHEMFLCCGQCVLFGVPALGTINNKYNKYLHLHI